MLRKITFVAVLGAALLSAGCARLGVSKTAEPETDEQTIVRLEKTPLYKFSEKEVDLYLGHLQETEPDLRARVVKLGRKNLGQPYKLYLLGEFPFETHDMEPLYKLTHSDCVVFSEHTYAMALSNDWPSFFNTLQRIRYKDGQIGVVTRNHYTETDWNLNNDWLLEDITLELAGESVKSYPIKVNRSKFLKDRYKIDRDIDIVEHTESYIPLEAIPGVLSELRDGDFVNVVVGKNDGYWVTHVGLIALGEDGTVNFLHSTPPKVREEPLMSYVERSLARADKAEAKVKEKGEGEMPTRLYGFKFLRLQDDPVANLATKGEALRQMAGTK